MIRKLIVVGSQCLYKVSIAISIAHSILRVDTSHTNCVLFASCIIDIPEQPRNITAVETQSRYLVLTWVEPHDNNAPILGYLVAYNQPVFAGGERVTLDVPKAMVNVTNLIPGVIYNFTVIAYNDIGNSTASETTSLRTLEEGEYQVFT